MILRLALTLILALTTAHAAPSVARGGRGAVASVHPLATQAIDAAVAIGLTLGVVDSHDSGIGGGGFLLIRRANGEFIGIDGLEMAGAAATRDMFIRNGKDDTSLSQTPSLPDARPRSDRFRCGGRESKFLGACPT